MQECVGKGYAEFWNYKGRYRVVKGSRGSKKSKTAALNRVFRIINYPKANYLCVRRYANTLRDSMYADTKWAIHRMGLDEYFECKVSPMEITYKPTNQKILFRGLDDGVKITSITVEHGVLCFVDIDEAYEIDQEDFDKLDLSIRGELPDDYFKQITLLFNPWSATSWLKKRFFDAPDEDTLATTTTWKCNEWLDEADRKVFEKMRDTNPRRYRIEGDGDWGIAEGLIFPNAVREEFNADTIRVLPDIKACFGLDFGYSDPNALVCMLLDNANLKIYIFDEWYKTGATNKEIAEAIKIKGYGSQVIICDSAEPKSIAELREEGIRAEASRKGRDSVKHGIQLIQNYRLIVHPRCANFWNAVQNYCWAKDRDGNPTNKPEHEFSHGCDAMRYGIGKQMLPDTFSFD